MRRSSRHFAAFDSELRIRKLLIGADKRIGAGLGQQVCLAPPNRSPSPRPYVASFDYRSPEMDKVYR